MHALFCFHCRRRVEPSITTLLSYAIFYCHAVQRTEFYDPHLLIHVPEYGTQSACITDYSRNLPLPQTTRQFSQIMNMIVKFLYT